MQSAEMQKLSDREMLLSSPGQVRSFLLDLEKRGNGDLRRYLYKALENPEMMAYLGYWEKWFSPVVRKIIDEKAARQNAKSTDELPLGLEKRFSENELRLIFTNVKSIQLTYGCSFGCPKCGIDAVKGAREHIPFPQLKNLFSRYGRYMKDRFFLYYASDPYDYCSGKKCYEDVHKLAVKYTQFRPTVTSKEVDDMRWLAFMRKEGRLVNIYRPRVSVYDLPKERIKKLEAFFAQKRPYEKKSRTWLVGKIGRAHV